VTEAAQRGTWIHTMSSSGRSVNATSVPEPIARSRRSAAARPSNPA
jgi:hypothetical protein